MPRSFLSKTGNKVLAVTIVVVLGLIAWNISFEVREPAAAAKPPATVAPSAITADLLILGADPAGLVIGTRVASKLGSKMIIIDSRDTIGGKEISQVLTGDVYLGENHTAKPVFLPANKDVLRSGDVIMRCFANSLSTIMVKALHSVVRQEYYIKGHNSTGTGCWGAGSTTHNSTYCAAGLPRDGVAPNGFLSLTLYGTNITNPCASSNWATCSYSTSYEDILTDPTNMATISVGQTFPEYAISLLGTDGAQLFDDTSPYGALVMDNDVDALWGAEYIAADLAAPVSHTIVPHGGPYIGIWGRAARTITTAGSSIKLGERLLGIKNTTGAQAATYPLTVTTDKAIYLAKAVVYTQPLTDLADLTGDVAATLAASTYVNYTSYRETCTMDMAFPFRFWEPVSSLRPTGGYFTIINDNVWTAPVNSSSYAAWQYTESANPNPDDSLEKVEYIATPERKEGNFLRFSFKRKNACSDLEDTYNGDARLIKIELMRRFRVRFASAWTTIPNPIEWYSMFLSKLMLNLLQYL